MGVGLAGARWENKEEEKKKLHHQDTKQRSMSDVIGQINYSIKNNISTDLFKRTKICIHDF
jgi:predicted transcriptional regulator